MQEQEPIAARGFGSGDQLAAAALGCGDISCPGCLGDSGRSVFGKGIAYNDFTYEAGLKAWHQAFEAKRQVICGVQCGNNYGKGSGHWKSLAGACDIRNSLGSAAFHLQSQMHKEYTYDQHL